jgi:DNA gyrase subunit A
MKLNEDRGSLVGGLVVTDNDEVIAIKASGQITRSAVAEVPVKGRDTMGVRFIGVGDKDAVVVIALNPETTSEVAELSTEVSELGTEARAIGDSTSAVGGDGGSAEAATAGRPASTDGAVEEDDSE